MGLNLKLLNENIEGYANTGYSADIGLFYKISDKLKFGVNARNVLGSLGSGVLTKNNGAGISFKFKNILMGADINFTNDNNKYIRCIKISGVNWLDKEKRCSNNNHRYQKKNRPVFTFC